MHQMFFDGSCIPNPGPMGLGVSLCDNNGVEIKSAAKNAGRGTNNQAEYLSLILGLELALKHGIKQLVCSGDSQLVINQVTLYWGCKCEGLRPLFERVMVLKEQFEKLEFRWIKRANNERADELSKNGQKMPFDELAGDDGIDPCEVDLDTAKHPVMEIVHYEPSIGFVVKENGVLYSINLNPVRCHCEAFHNDKSCIHIQAVILQCEHEKKRKRYAH